MKVRRNVTRPDTSAWPEFDPGTLATALRKTFGARRRAVEMFAADSSLTEIEAQTGVNRRQVYRALESAPALHADGRPYGWRAWVPHTRVGDYHRLAKVRRHAVTPSGSAPPAPSVCCWEPSRCTIAFGSAPRAWRWRITA